MSVPINLIPNNILIEVTDTSPNSIVVTQGLGYGTVRDTYVGCLYSNGDFVCFFLPDTLQQISYANVSYYIIDDRTIRYIENPPL